MATRGAEKKILQPRFRILCGKEIALGPGKVELLRHVQETGSIRGAAARMEMSYMRAWTLIRTMNTRFKEPLVLAVRGGNKGGGAELTESGRKALAFYQQMEVQSRGAIERTWKALETMLK